MGKQDTHPIMQVRFEMRKSEPLPKEASDMLASKLYFEEWLQGAEEYLPPDLAEAGRRVLYYSDKTWNPEQIMTMVNIVAEAYERYQQKNT